MNREGLAEELNRLLAMETHSLSRHLEEATPYLSPRTYKLWRRIARAIHADTDHADRLSHLIDRLELPLKPAGFDTDVASLHYARLETLLPHLIEEKRRQVEAYDRAIEHASADVAVRAELEALRADNRAQLAELESAAAELGIAQPA